jgi:hypothetical protein
VSSEELRVEKLVKEEQNSGEKLRLSAETVSKNVEVIDDGTEIVISIKITHQEQRSEVMHALHQVFEQLTALESPSLGRK